MGPYDSGEICTGIHKWMIKGSYLVKVKVKDQWGIESEWSDLLKKKKKKRKSYDITHYKLINFYNIYLLKYFS